MPIDAATKSREQYIYALLAEYRRVIHSIIGGIHASDVSILEFVDMFNTYLCSDQGVVRQKLNPEQMLDHKISCTGAVVLFGLFHLMKNEIDYFEDPSILVRCSSTSLSMSHTNSDKHTVIKTGDNIFHWTMEERLHKIDKLPVARHGTYSGIKDYLMAMLGVYKLPNRVKNDLKAKQLEMSRLD